jgi:hypothetical protein
VCYRTSRSELDPAGVSTCRRQIRPNTETLTDAEHLVVGSTGAVGGPWWDAGR